MNASEVWVQPLSSLATMCTAITELQSRMKHAKKRNANLVDAATRCQALVKALMAFSEGTSAVLLSRADCKIQLQQLKENEEALRQALQKAADFMEETRKRGPFWWLFQGTLLKQQINDMGATSRVAFDKCVQSLEWFRQLDERENGGKFARHSALVNLMTLCATKTTNLASIEDNKEEDIKTDLMVSEELDQAFLGQIELLHEFRGNLERFANQFRDPDNLPLDEKQMQIYKRATVLREHIRQSKATLEKLQMKMQVGASHSSVVEQELSLSLKEKSKELEALQAEDAVIQQRILQMRDEAKDTLLKQFGNLDGEVRAELQKDFRKRHVVNFEEAAFGRRGGLDGMSKAVAAMIGRLERLQRRLSVRMTKLRFMNNDLQLLNLLQRHNVRNEILQTVRSAQQEVLAMSAVSLIPSPAVPLAAVGQPFSPSQFRADSNNLDSMFFSP